MEFIIETHIFPIIPLTYDTCAKMATKVKVGMGRLKNKSSEFDSSFDERESVRSGLNAFVNHTKAKNPRPSSPPKS